MDTSERNSRKQRSYLRAIMRMSGRERAEFLARVIDPESELHLDPIALERARLLDPEAWSDE